MIQAKTIFAPSKTTNNSLTGTTDSLPFNVDGHSRVNYIWPLVGETITEADIFELRRVIASAPQRSIRQYEKINGVDTVILLGSTRTQFEVLVRGTYLLRKLKSTTEDMGASQTYGNDEGV